MWLTRRVSPSGQDRAGAPFHSSLPSSPLQADKECIQALHTSWRRGWTPPPSAAFCADPSECVSSMGCSWTWSLPEQGWATSSTQKPPSSTGCRQGRGQRTWVLHRCLLSAGRDAERAVPAFASQACKLPSEKCYGGGGRAPQGWAVCRPGSSVGQPLTPACSSLLFILPPGATDALQNECAREMDPFHSPCGSASSNGSWKSGRPRARHSQDEKSQLHPPPPPLLLWGGWLPGPLSWLLLLPGTDQRALPA